MILILTQKGGCDCGFVISYLLFVVDDDSDTFTRIHTFLSRRKETDRERERLGTTVEKFDDRKKIF